MKTKSITNEIKSYLLDKLSDYAGCSSYGCDLAYLLTEGENANGSVYCNTYKTKELIKNNFELFGDFIEYYNREIGEMLNPFNEPEKCHVCFLIESVSAILSQCKFIDDNWNEKFELTPKVIRSIKKDVKSFKELEF